MPKAAIRPNQDPRVSTRRGPEPPQVGDKVRIKSGSKTAKRGVLTAIQGQRVRVRLADGTQTMTTLLSITNYSAAARRAWQTMPKRAGRPVNPNRKIQVSLRIDERAWRELGALAAAGRIRSREHLVNTLLAAAARHLTGAHRSNRARTPFPITGLKIPESTEQA